LKIRTVIASTEIPGETWPQECAERRRLTQKAIDAISVVYILRDRIGAEGYAELVPRESRIARRNESLALLAPNFFIQRTFRHYRAQC
jgi:hypothetical protein